MTRNFKRCGVMTALVLACGASAPAFAADGESAESRDLSAQWWQWALSLSAKGHPLSEATDVGSACMDGQRGPVWFLGGTLLVGGTATRRCSVPEGVTLFFPVVNTVQINTPGVCGSGDDNVPTADLRDTAKTFIDGVTVRSATLDGKPLRSVRRVRSTVFPVVLPTDNAFVPLCAPLPVPAGVYSPSVDDGYYASVAGLSPGEHVLTIHAVRPDLKPENTYETAVTYRLTVVPVARQ
jgi:hypothetical protein